MFEGVTKLFKQGVDNAKNSVINWVIPQNIPEEVTDVAVKPFQAGQVDSELTELTQDPSLENFTKLTNQIGGMFTRTRDHESYSLIIQHLKGNTAEEKAANFRKLFKATQKEDGTVRLVFAPTNKEISECLTENNSRIRAACMELQNATRYAATGSNDPTIIKSLVGIGYGATELGSQVHNKLRKIGEVVQGLTPQPQKKGTKNNAR